MLSVDIFPWHTDGSKLATEFSIIKCPGPRIHLRNHDSQIGSSAGSHQTALANKIEIVQAHFIHALNIPARALSIMTS